MVNKSKPAVIHITIDASGSNATYTTGNFTTANATTGNIVTGIVTTLFTSGTATIATGNIVTGVVTTLSGSNATYTTGNLTTLNATTGNIVTGVVTTLSVTQLNVSGVSTFASNVNLNAALLLPQNPTGVGFGTTTANPQYAIRQTMGDNDGWQIFGESPSGTNTGSLVLEVNDDVDTNERIIFRNRRNYSGAVIGVTTFLEMSSTSNIIESNSLLIGTRTLTGTSSQRLQVTGGAYVSGNLGIGNTNPQNPLHISGTQGTLLRIDGGSGGTGTRDIVITEFDTPAYGGIIRYDSSQDTFTIGTLENSVVQYALNIARATGNVGVGYTQLNPTVKLAVNGTTLINTNSLTGTASQPLQVNGGAYVSGSVGIGTTNPTTTLQVQGTTKVETSIGSTQSIWYGTLDSKGYSAKSVSLLVQPETAYSFDASQTVGKAYEPVIFSHALTSANGSYSPSLYSFQNLTNVAGTSSTARINGFGFYNYVFRNSTTDVSSYASNSLYGIISQVVQGNSVDQSVVTGFAYGNRNVVGIQKATATTIYGNFTTTNIGAIANNSASSTNAYGSYNLMQVGAASGTGIGTLTNYYGYYVAPTVALTGQLTNYYGVYLATPIVNGTLTNRYSIYSSDTSSPMYHAGSIGIGTTIPTSKLTVEGDVRVSGASTFVGLVELDSSLRDFYGNVGAAGSVLIATGAGVTSPAPSFDTSMNEFLPVNFFWPHDLNVSTSISPLEKSLARNKPEPSIV